MGLLFIIKWSFLQNLESLSPKNALFQVWLKLTQWFCRRIFDVGGALHLNELEHPSPKHALCHVWLNLGALESPSPKDTLCQVWLNLAEWFLRRFLNFVNMFSSFLNYLPLEEIGVALHLNKVWLNMAQWFLRRRF